MDTLILSIKSIKGNSTLNGYADKIILDSYAHSLSLPMNSDVAKTERTMGRAAFSEFTFTKMTDVSTPPMYAACAAGTKLGDVTLSLGRNEGGNVMLMIEYVLSNAMISNIATSGGAGGAMDSFSINFTKMTTVYTQQKTDSDKKGNSNFGWDLTTNKSA